MSSHNNEDLKDFLKRKILFEGLELADLGISFEDITDSVTLVGDDGLALDSVDALEIISLLQRHFGIKVADANKEFFATHLKSFDRLYAFVSTNMKQEVA
jgi:acyl carrier protein